MTIRTATIRSAFLPLFVGASVAMLAAMGGCGSANTGLGPGHTGNQLADDDGAAGDSGDNSTVYTFGEGGSFSVPQQDSAPAVACTSGSGQLGCYVQSCPNGGSTTLTGIVYDPAGKNPIYNAVVFVPNSTTGALPPITPGTSSCNTCQASIGDYVTATLTHAKGEFTLTGVPATTHVPLVVQIGKWRREVFLSEVKACTDNAVAADDSRLPASQSEGSMPQMALLTGGADNLGCFLTGLGIANSEWTAPHGGGRLDVYQGAGGAGLTSGTAGTCNTATAGACGLWSTLPDLQYYDIVLLACEGGTNDPYKAAPAMENMHTWLDEGGKVFGTHFHYTWFKDGPANGCANCTDFVNTATWLGTSGGDGSGNYTIDTTFYGGTILQQWLANLKLVTGNTIALNGVANSVSTVNSTAQRWIYDPSTNDTKYMTILTPIGGVPPAADAGKAESSTPQYCGKAVFSDLHAGGSSFGNINLDAGLAGLLGGLTTGNGGTVPGSCPTNTSLTAQEAALEFLFFDLSACVSVATTPPVIPPSQQPQ
jgi:hypothetical protein